MAGRHRFAGRDRTVRPLLAAVIPVVAVLGLTAAALMGGESPATSTARIEVPRFAGPDSVSAPAVTSAALPSALPEGVPMIMNISSSGSSAVQRISAERAEAARRAEQERQARAARAARAAQLAREQESREAAQRERAAQEARQRALRPPATTARAPTTAPRTAAPRTTTPAPSRSTGPDRDPATQQPGRDLLDTLLGGRSN